jgi:hypothetical protein
MKGIRTTDCKDKIAQSSTGKLQKRITKGQEIEKTVGGQNSLETFHISSILPPPPNNSALHFG